jgi:hypothetical protein
MHNLRTAANLGQNLRDERNMGRLAKTVKSEGLILVASHPLFLENTPFWRDRTVVDVENRKQPGAKKQILIDKEATKKEIEQYPRYRQNTLEFLACFDLEKSNRWFLLNDVTSILDLYHLLYGEGIFSGRQLSQKQANRFIPSGQGEYKTEWIEPEIRHSGGVLSFGMWKNISVKRTREQLRTDFGAELLIVENPLLVL